jgi:hypothetical protein
MKKKDKKRLQTALVLGGLGITGFVVFLFARDLLAKDRPAEQARDELYGYPRY